MSLTKKDGQVAKSKGSTLAIGLLAVAGLLTVPIKLAFEEPYIPNAATYDFVSLGMPLVSGLATVYLLFTAEVDRSGQTSWQRLVKASGVVAAFARVVLGLLIVMASVYVLARMCWIRDFAYPAELIGGQPESLDAVFVGTRGYGRSFSRTDILIVRLSGRDRTEEILWPKKNIALLGKCADGKIVLSGAGSPLGIVVKDIGCAFAQSHA